MRTIIERKHELVIAAIHVVTSVSDALVKRNQAKRASGQPIAATLVDPFALLDLIAVIEAQYPGVIERTRKQP